VSKSPLPPEHTGRVIGNRYEIEEALGRGGMAAVYRVRDLRTGAKLALKRSWARSSRKELRRRASLEREYQTLVHLSHPRIIEVYDYGLDEDGPYYTMELLDGADLDKTGQLPWKEACALLRDIASSLAILHSRGLVHRDVSARNVRRTADGRAKLIDFGAMASMGVASDVVGTPPFMAPEVLQMQALDARADLFSLGALGYYLITGRHAYPARKLSDLRDAWRSRPASPCRLVPDTPAALGDLIVELLSLDRGARPQNAAEVMERLCTIAELPIEELGKVSRAYLAMPMLVGRESALVAVRSRMLSLVRGDGGTLMVEGVAGSGRSRLLQACMLEAKLLGAHVVHTDPNDSVAGEWGVARAICSALIELFPKQTAEAVRLSRDVLSHVIDELNRDASQTVSTSFPERSLMLRELRDFVLAISRGQRLLLVVDDADRIDETSAALLAAIADKTARESLILVLAVERGPEPTTSPSIQLLSALAHHIELQPLAAEQTEALMRSVFGDAANLQLCAGRIHALAQGNPRTTLELAQHLLDRGLARYEAGSWLMPSQLDEVDLPATLSESLTRRVQQLSRDARELAEALCLTDGYALPLASYRGLTTHRDQARVFRGLQELVAARVLIAAAEHYCFSQSGFLTVLREAMSAARSASLHSRLASLLAANGGDALRRAYHLLHGEREAEAIELLCSLDLLARLPPVSLLAGAIEAAERDAKQPVRVLHHLRMAMVIKAPLVGSIDDFRRCLPPVLERLVQDSGLALYSELSHLPAAERLEQALSQQQQRHLAAADNDRVYGVGDAIRELARLSGATTAIAVAFFDLELLESLPSLEPLLPLSPSLHVVTQLIEAGKEWICGRGMRSQMLYKQALARIAQPDRAGFDEVQFERIRLGVHYTLALIEAAQGVAAAEERAKILESNRAMRVTAWRVRMLLNLNQGNAEAARKCLRRAELLQLQDGESHYLGMTAGFELMSCALAGDLLGVKTAVDALTALAQRHHGWRPMLIYGQSRYRELQGDLPAALELALAGLEIALPGRHLVFGKFAEAHVRILHALGRLDEAVAIGDAYIAICNRDQLTPMDRFIHREMSLVLAHTGQSERALGLIDPLIVDAERLGAGGLSLGVLYEARARIALFMADREGFERASERCAIEYRKGNSPVLSARFARLVEDASHQQIQPAEAVRELTEFMQTAQSESEHNTVRGRLFECIDRADRARCSLTILLQTTETFQGYLFGVDAANLTLLGGIPDAAPQAGLGHWLETWVAAERQLDAFSTSAGSDTVSQRARKRAARGADSEESVTGTDSVETDSQASQHEVPSSYVDADGRCFEAIMLVGEYRKQARVAAVLALHVTRDRQRRPPRSLLAEIACHLLEQNDVSGADLGA
jgi:uncharacterized protein YidB (DUF937 family)